MSKNPTLYVAYGSNLNLEQMAYRCPTAKIAGTTELRDYELLFRGSSVRGGRGAVATVEPKEGASVPVLLWKIREKDEQALDRYEGFPHFYHKEQLPVKLGGRELSAMIYVMNPGLELGVPSDSYYDTIVQGYESAGFDLDVLDAAVEESYSRSLTEVLPEPEDYQQSLFGQEEQSEFALELEAMVENATPELTARWEDYTRGAAESYGPGEENLELYRDELLGELRNVLDEFGPEIVRQLYETGGMDHADLLGAAEYLAQGGDPSQLENLADDGQLMRL